MSYDRTENRVNPPPLGSYKPQSRIGLITGIIILIVVVLVLIVILIILAVRYRSKTKLECTTNANCAAGKLCSNNKCVDCISPPSTPTGVSIVYDLNLGTATINWSNTASSYKIYRKIGDPSVGVNNYDQVDSVTGTSKSYTNLEYGTHYFVITAINSCGESQPSSPVIFAPSCINIPSTMSAPVVTQTSNDCAGSTNSDIVEVSFTDESIENGVYVVQGTGQKGNISPYFYLVDGSSFGPATNIHLTCGNLSTNHRVTQITNVVGATLTTTGPVVTGTSFNATWNLVAGMERYAVFIVGVDTNGVPHYYGGYADGNSSSLSLPTNNGDTLVFGLVLGFRLCDLSETSLVTVYNTDT